MKPGCHDSKGLNLLLFAASLVFLGATSVAAKAEVAPANAQVDKVFADLQKPGSPGCALAVLRNAQIIYSKGYGLASVELNVPITAQSIFDIGSTSKQFTAASILLLEQQGKLSVNDDVRKYIPELPDYSKTGGGKITILNLLNHTSGLRDYLGLLQLSGVSVDSVTTDEDALSLVVRQKNLNFAPGSEWAYSNTGFFLLSVIVKRVSGMTLKEFAAQNIFQPLQMAHTTFRDDHTLLIPHRALAYDPNANGGYKLNVSYYEQLGDGAVHTSVEDLAKWDENFYTGQIGGKSFLAEIQEPGKLTNGKVLEYAKGLFIQNSRGLRTVRHGGAWGGYRAELLRFPDQHFSVACLCNLGNANPEKRADEVAAVYLGGLMQPDYSPGQAVKSAAGVALTSAQMAAVAGMYRDPAKGRVARISEAKGRLQLEIEGTSFGLSAISPTQFVVADPPLNVKLTFELGSDPAHRSMKTSGSEISAATYQAVAEAAPSADQLAAYCGDFESSELGVIYRLQLVEQKLKLVEISDKSGNPRTGIPTPAILRPTIADEFEIGDLGMTADFVTNTKHEISGFNLNGGGMHGIWFSRMALLRDSAGDEPLLVRPGAKTE